MTDFFTNEIFAPEDDNDAALEDVQTAMAGALFEKLAEEAGVDPDSLTSQERAAYINQLRGKEAPGASKEASTTMTMTPEEQQQQIEWDAFVTQEAIKTAAAHDVDALEMEPADFAELKASVEQVIAADVEGYMQKLSAAYEEENAALVADEQFEQKMAEAKLAGQQMAITFADMLGLEIPAEKVAGVGGKLKGFLARAGERAQGASETIGRGVEKHTGIGRGGAKKILEAASEIPKGRSGAGLSEHANAEARSALKKHYGNVGKAAVGTGAALGVAGGAAAASGRSKKSAEEIQAEGLAVARAFMIAQGIDPDSGSKLASLDNLEPEVEAAAAALLERAGINLG